MDINLRGIGAELHQSLKVRAASEGVTLQSLCVRYFWWGLDASARDDAMSVGAEVANGSGLARCEQQRKQSPVGSIPTPQTKRSLHDPETCRLYKCGMCALEKAK
jgi:hypothetical protein